MPKLTFQKLASGSGSKVLIENLQTLQCWYRSMEPHEIFKELSSKEPSEKIMCLKKDEIIRKLKVLYPVVNDYVVSKKYRSGVPDQVTQVVQDSWVKQLTSKLSDGGKTYYLCRDQAIRHSFNKGFKAAERHAEEIKSWNRNNRENIAEGWETLRLEFQSEGFDRYLRVNGDDRDMISWMETVSFDELYFNAMQNNCNKIRTALTKAAPNQDTLKSKGIVRVGGTSAERKVTLTLRWSVGCEMH